MHESAWRVLHVIANHEKKVAQYLSVRSVEHYLPLYVERSRWTDRTVLIERPLFTGYVFVRFQPVARISVISTPGVIRLLGDGDSQTVSSEELSRIRSGLSTGCLLRPHPNVSVGTTVTVRRGAFAGVQGIVTELREQCNVVICLAAVQQCFSLEIAVSDLEILGRPFARPAGVSGPTAAVA